MVRTRTDQGCARFFPNDTRPVSPPAPKLSASAWFYMLHMDDMPNLPIDQGGCSVLLLVVGMIFQHSFFGSLCIHYVLLLL